jgi:DNA polymerase-3 subunit alpha
MESVLGTTYGKPIYQEQIMQIFNKFAGFSLGQADIIRRLMSKKKVKEFQEYKVKFVDGLVSKGANKEDAENFWNELEKFSLYAFNKSHSTAYAIVAYYTAWLKHYYPAEFFAAVFNSTEFDKLGTLIAECKEFGIEMLPANINKCTTDFVAFDNKIFVGLSSIKGVANSASIIINERQNAQFNNFIDFLLRAKVSKDVIENLVYAGAFDDFTQNRQALINALPDYQDIIKKIRQKETIIANLENAISETDISKKERAIEAREKLVNELSSVSVNLLGEEDVLSRLEKEKEVIGAFISGHPLDSYGKPEDLKCVPIADIDVQKNISIMGMIKNLKVTARKSDGKSLAFFTIEDRTGEVKVNCFTYAYSQNKDFIEEDAVVIATGDIVQNEDVFNNEIVYELNLQSVKPIQKKKRFIAIKMKDITEWEAIKEMIKPYRVKEETGY